jgi:hypothetical protein
MARPCPGRWIGGTCRCRSRRSGRAAGLCGPVADGPGADHGGADAGVGVEVEAGQPGSASLQPHLVATFGLEAAATPPPRTACPRGRPPSKSRWPSAAPGSLPPATAVAARPADDGHGLRVTVHSSGSVVAYFHDPGLASLAGHADLPLPQPLGFPWGPSCSVRTCGRSVGSACRSRRLAAARPVLPARRNPRSDPKSSDRGTTGHAGCSLSEWAITMVAWRASTIFSPGW